MHKKTAGLLLGSVTLAIGVFSAFAFTSKKADLVTFATYTNGDAATYYNSIDDTQSGNTLLTALRNLNLSKRQSTVGYSSMGTSPSGQFKYTDYDPDYVEYDSKGQPYGTRISSFYTYTSATSWNREHVWPNSHGGGSGGDTGSPYPDADIHMPRPTISSENSSRGNSFYVEGMNHSSNGWDPLTAGYGAESRGEAARITFYCTLVNSKLVLAPNNTTPSGSDPVTGQSYGSGHTMGNLETLIKWNINYPVTQREKNRNEGAEYLQGNRNAFVDHPEYACKIWGNVNSNIKSMCQNASWDTPAGVSLDKTTLSMVVDGTATLTATSTDSSQITWTSSDATVVDVNVATSASGAAVTIEAIGPGTANITASVTIEGTPYTARCAVTVSSSGGGGGDTPVSGDYSITISDLDNAYPTTAKDYTAASGIKFKAYNCANFSSKVQFKKSGGYIYSTQSLNLASIKLNSPSGSLTVYGGTSQNPSSNAITGSNGIYNLSGCNYFKIINSSESVATCSSITISVADESDDPVLQSIEVSTPPSKTIYSAGEYFNPTGLVITRNYSDDSSDTYAYAGHASEFTFTPSTSTALTTDDSGITISYGGKTCEQEITVNPVPATSITATPDKTFYVGETITVADITVKDNNNNTITDFTFANNDYQFTYEDAASGGALTNKTFSNSITYGNLHCSLTVQVQRKAYVAPAAAVTDIITANDLAATDTQYKNFSNVSKSSDAKYAGNSAKTTGGAIQMRSKDNNSGLVSTHSGGTVSSVKITVASGSNVIQVYGKNTAYSSASDLYDSNSQGTLVGSVSSTGTATFTTGYAYVGIRSASGAIYMTSIEISYGSSETAVNVANYIMFEDTNGQCETKLSIAIGYLNNTSASEFELFMNSDGYVLATARTRLYAWAANQGKVISISNNHVTLSSANNINGIGDASVRDNTTMILVITISLSLTTMVGLVILKKKKSKR